MTTKQGTKTTTAATTASPIEGLAHGRMVHFHDGTKVKGTDTLKPKAATVADVLDATAGRCNLAVLEHSGATKPAHDVPYSAEPAEGTWSWPKKA